MASYALCPSRSEAESQIIEAILKQWERQKQVAREDQGGAAVQDYIQFFVPCSYGERVPLQPRIEAYLFAALGAALSPSDDSTESIITRIGEIVSDQDQYQVDEQPPSKRTIDAAIGLLRSMANIGYNNLPKTYISVYYGEIAVTWKTDTNLVRLTFRPNGSIQLYRQPDYRDSARGESIPVTVDDNVRVAEYIRWLSGA